MERESRLVKGGVGKRGGKLGRRETDSYRLTEKTDVNIKHAVMGL